MCFFIITNRFCMPPGMGRKISQTSILSAGEIYDALRISRGAGGNDNETVWNSAFNLFFNVWPSKEIWLEGVYIGWRWFGGHLFVGIKFLETTGSMRNIISLSLQETRAWHEKHLISSAWFLVIESCMWSTYCEYVRDLVYTTNIYV